MALSLTRHNRLIEVIIFHHRLTSRQYQGYVPDDKSVNWLLMELAAVGFIRASDRTSFKLQDLRGGRDLSPLMTLRRARLGSPAFLLVAHWDAPLPWGWLPWQDDH